MRQKPSTILGFSYFELALILAAIVMLAVIMIRNSHARAAERLYPSIGQLQAALNARLGERLPPQVPQIIANGRAWTGYYVGAKEIGPGRYSIIIELR